MNFPDNPYEELNLYTNFSNAVNSFPNVAIYFDETLIGFPDLGVETTYEETLNSILKHANRLSSLGIKKNDKVVIYKSANIDTYLLAVSVSYLGAVPVMISYHLPPKTMTIMCERLENPWLLYDAVTAKNVLKITSISSTRLIELESLIHLEVTESTTQEFLEPDAVSYMTHTSGTTGIPKFIAHSAKSMGWRTKWQKNIFDLMPEKKLVAFHISPVHSRFNIGVSSLMSKGFPMLWMGNSDLSAVKKTLSKFKPYALETHPNNFVQWSKLAKKSPDLFKSFHYFHSTFDAINKGTMSIFLENSEAKNPVFMQVYGQSECGPMIMRFHNKESIVDLNARNMGSGMPDLTEVRIVDDAAKEVGTGLSGNIQMLSKGRALTYYKEDARFTENTYDLWWDSGDFGYKDTLGDLYLLDRQIDLINDIESTLRIEDILLDQLDFLDEVVIVRGKDNVPQPIISINKTKEMNWEQWFHAILDFPLLNEPLIWDYDAIPRTATMKVKRLEIEEGLKN